LIRRLASVALAAATLLGCTTTDDAVVDTPEQPAMPASASNYTFELVEFGDDERHTLVAPVPVGRTVDVVVSLSSLGETLDVQLEATVVQADAGGESQLIELVILGVEADLSTRRRLRSSAFPPTRSSFASRCRTERSRSAADLERSCRTNKRSLSTTPRSLSLPSV